jgi:hypothetical protein
MSNTFKLQVLSMTILEMYLLPFPRIELHQNTLSKMKQSINNIKYFQTSSIISDNLKKALIAISQNRIASKYIKQNETEHQ